MRTDSITLITSQSASHDTLQLRGKKIEMKATFEYVCGPSKGAGSRE